MPEPSAEPPLVSVCIPCRNAGAHLAETLESVCGQTWPRLEVIVVDDDSRDGSAEIIDGFAARGVRRIAAQSGSAAKARNRAFAAASGSLIKFLDADDLLSPDMIERQVTRLGGRTDALASSEWGRFYGSIETFRPAPQSVWRDLAPVDWLAEALRGAQPMMQCGMYLIPRPLLEKAGGWDERLTLIDDFEFFTRLFLAAAEILFTPGAVLYYRSGDQRSLSGQRSRKHAESAFLSIQLAARHLSAAEDSPRTRAALADVWQSYAYDFAAEHPDLSRTAEQAAIRCGVSDLPFPGGRLPKMLASAFGWRTARRIQHLIHRAGYRNWRSRPQTP